MSVSATVSRGGQGQGQCQGHGRRQGQWQCQCHGQDQGQCHGQGRVEGQGGMGTAGPKILLRFSEGAFECGKVLI